MANHGITINETATSLLSPVEATAGLPVVVGTAPVNQSKETAAPVNVPILCYSFAEAVGAFGYSADWQKYTLCEFMDSHFRQYALKPVVFINVLNPAEHNTAVPSASKAVVNRMVTLAEEGILLNTVVVKDSGGTTTYKKDTDYTLAFNSDGYVIISLKSTVPADTKELSVAYSKLDPGAIDSTDIIGGVSPEGKVTGLELIQEVFPRFGLVPGLILAPGYSSDPVVASVMTAKASNINSVFKALALTDIDTTEVKRYTDAPLWKNSNNYVSDMQVPLWPMVKLGEYKYHMSTQLAGVIGATDAANGGIPSVSPSNKSFKANGLVLADGTDVLLGLDQSNYLNSQGIVTGLNFIGGLKAWGNYTGAYPAVTDPKDCFIPIRRMFNWVGNSLVLTYWQKVDDPMNKRLTQTVVDSINIWLNGLTSSGNLLGGRVEFRAEDNPTTSLMAGIIRFKIFLTPPGPAQELVMDLEYDTSYLSVLAA
ncbi:MAG: phage tail sheath family protein [Paenibacillus macerans]|nr:phage tail sheath family protein [Paenibacillus macerans]